jgi:hypothetical protein
MTVAPGALMANLLTIRRSKHSSLDGGSDVGFVHTGVERFPAYDCTGDISKEIRICNLHTRCAAGLWAFRGSVLTSESLSRNRLQRTAFPSDKATLRIINDRS